MSRWVEIGLEILEKKNFLMRYKFEYHSFKDALLQVQLKLVLMGISHGWSKDHFEFPYPKDSMCLVWMKVVQWF